jgi:hypothetical protein
MDPLTGLWRLDLTASEFSTPSPVAWTLNISAQQTGMTVDENISRADGIELRVAFAPQFDGRYYPVQASPIMDSISIVRRSERLLEVSARQAGATSMRDTTEVSPDGQTLTVTFSMLSAEQAVANGVAVFRRARSTGTLPVRSGSGGG